MLLVLLKYILPDSAWISNSLVLFQLILVQPPADAYETGGYVLARTLLAAARAT
jgi:hypothetical protein